MNHANRILERHWPGSFCIAALLVSHPQLGGESDALATARVSHRTYTTTFRSSGNPISEHGNWTNGREDGLDWTNVRTTPGFAFGTEPGGHRPAPLEYDDSAALLTGPWNSDQTAQATVHAVHQNEKVYEEVELRLRSKLAPHKATGYEILFRSLTGENAYCEIVRWNGALGDFTYLARAKGPKCGVAEGSAVKATAKSAVITAYINGVQVVQATDSTFPDGSPGIGFFLQGATGLNQDYGFTSFTASDDEAKK